jgi:putative ABC transport system permease protein
MNSPLQNVLREGWHSRLNSALVLLALTGAVALLTAVSLLTSAAERETRRVVRDLGFNLRILPKETDPERFFLEGYSENTLPADAVTRLAAGAGTFITFNHLTPVLERRIRIGGHECLLTGLGDTVVGPGEKKQPMGFRIAPGTAHVGSILAERLGVKPGAVVEVSGRSLRVEKVLVEAGTEEDVRLYAALPDAQAALGLPGRISEIKAIDCLCLTADQDPLPKIREALARVLPEARVIQMRTLADARAKQRQASERVSAFAVPTTLLVASVWILVLAVLNVRQRRVEIGLWRALGTCSARIAALFLGKAVLLGFLGGLLGWGLGTGVALHWGPELFPVTAASLKMDASLLPLALVLTPMFAAVATFLPAMMAVAQDPAETLRTDG